MRGNRTSPVAALLAPLAGYGQGVLEEQERSRAVAEAMRRAAREDADLQLQQQAAARSERMARLQEQEVTERATARGRAREIFGRLRERSQQPGYQFSATDMFDLAEAEPSLAGVGPILKQMRPYNLAEDPEYQRQSALARLRSDLDLRELNRRKELGLGGGANAMTPEERFQQRVVAIFGQLRAAAAANFEDFDPNAAMQDAVRIAQMMPGAVAPPTPTPPARAPTDATAAPTAGDAGAMFGDSAFLRILGIEPTPPAPSPNGRRGSQSSRGL